MSKVNTVSKNVWLMFSLGMLFGVSSAHAATTLAIPQVPLQTGSDVPINLMFVIDDSGSMARSYLPDNINNVCKNTTSVEDRARGRSPDYNKAYFDPDEEYVVPPKADGSLYPVPTLTGAWKDGYAGTGLVNLTTKFRATWENNGNYCGGEGDADYYRYDADECETDSDEDNQCYKRYIVEEQSTEIQDKFAIWYSYYRNRKMASQAGIGRAFATLPESMRVGYGSINKDSVTRGVREFAGVDRSDFFKWLYKLGNPSGATPLRGALKELGEYYKTDVPYLTVPTDSSSGLVSCRQNFSILMSDGGWNETKSPLVGDADDDGHANTLADVAYKYWKDDLRPEAEMPNNVPTAQAGDAEWQHMVTYAVGLGVEGNLVYDEVKDWAPDASGWNYPGCDSCAADPRKVDDFIHAAVNSKGGFFSARSPGEFAKELTDTLNNIQLRTASATNLSATTTSLQEDNSVFQASFNTKSWTGDLVSRDVDNLATIQWSANFPTDWEEERQIFTSRNNVMMPFKWSELNSAEQLVLKNESTVNYLRGDRQNEKTKDEPTRLYRERISLLGDIAHSSPLYVAESQNRNYQRYNWDGAASYQGFVTATKTRAPRVYIGANDGMLHSFNADASAADAGIETFAYVPAAMLADGSRLADFASPDYEHRFFVDGSPTVADVYIGGSWRSVLVSTLGRGGEWMFALDVTDPTDVKVLWDIKIPELGIMPHKPIITRLNNDRWSVVTGYGYNNSAGKSGLLIVDLEKGPDADIIKLKTSETDAIGLAQVEGWDQTKNGNIDWIFAGDINGNVWKFDLSATSAGGWKVANSGNPLFAATDTAGNRQPITGGVTLQSHPETAELWVFFGTGKFIETGDSVNADKQSWYGIKDGSPISDRSQLVSRTMSNVTYTNPVTSEERTTRSVPVAAENDMVDKRGWVMDLPDTRERIISKPRFVGGNLVMNTTIPDTDLCNPQGDGWIMAVDPFKGSRLNYHFFDLSRDDTFNGDDGIGPDDDIASGLRFSGMPGEPVFVGDEMLVGDSRVAIDSSRVNLQIRRGRMSWRELINQ